MSIGHYFYSKRAAYVILGFAVAAGTVCFAQSGRKKKDKGPRALAVVELSADGKSAARLIPVTILVDGRFWDAGSYMADPRPLALDAGNVYEVERNGEPVGTFTVGQVSEVNDQWLALGQWEPRTAQADTGKKQDSSSKPAKPAAADDEDRPVLHKHPDSGAAPASKTRASATPASTTAASAPERPPDDPNRPVLRRGKPKPQPDESTFEPGPAKAPPAPIKPFKAKEVLAAVSDAGGPEPHAYKYETSAADDEKLKKAITDVASAELAAYVKRTPGLRIVPSGKFDQVSVRIFDLHFDNYPEVVLTARVPGEAPARRDVKQPSASNFFFYVTVVGQTDLYGEMRKLFSSVTDSQHLDVFPRMELIDSVDAEGTGRGDLLFRAYSDGSPAYQLYHVGPDSLRKLFDSGGNY